MLTKRLSALVLACLVASPSYARCHGRPFFRHRVRVARVVAPRPSPQVMGAGLATPQASPQVVYESRTVTTYSTDAGAFLSQLNQWRARNGRGPLQWDGNLASYAASNTGVHAPGSSGGGSQCWSGYSSLTQSLSLWIASPAHASILLNANVSVGASACPSGSTANCR